MKQFAIELGLSPQQTEGISLGNIHKFLVTYTVWRYGKRRKKNEAV